IDLGEHLRARQAGFEDNQIRRRILVVMRHRSSNTTHVHADMALGEAPIGARRLQPPRLPDSRRTLEWKCAVSAAPWRASAARGTVMQPEPTPTRFRPRPWQGRGPACSWFASIIRRL